MSDFGGLTCVNIELSSVCRKNCKFCGRRKLDREYPEKALQYGYMSLELMQKIAEQLPKSKILLQLHFNGESLEHPNLKESLQIFQNHIRCLNTNGQLLLKKFDEIVENLDTITISIIEGDQTWEEQYKILKEFLNKKGNRKPWVVIRCTGDIPAEQRKLYENLNCLIADRILHDPMGSYNYTHPPVVPEHGICCEIMSKLVIDRFGVVRACARFDYDDENILGDINDETLLEIWNGERRQKLLQMHVDGRRNEISFCNRCKFFGIPRGAK
ncbi:MAG: SPASM domain-containing protein [Methanocellales archaeon]|nr:SPASM domain-containing protein [Methanocellales archaeon]